MPTATKHDSTPTRRGALKFSVAAIAAGVTAPAPAETSTPAGPDAELLALVRDLVQQEAVLCLIGVEMRSVSCNTPECEDLEQRSSDADDIWLEIAGRIANTRARSSTGVRAKAEAMRIVLLRDVAHIVNGVPEPLDVMAANTLNSAEDRMAWSLARDLLEGSAAA